MAQLLLLPAPDVPLPRHAGRREAALRGELQAMAGRWLDLDRAVAAAIGRLDALEEGGPSPDARLRRVARDVASAALIEAALPAKGRPADPAALDRLIALWQPDVHRWARLLCGAELCLEEVAHDALLVACTRLGSLEDPLRFRGWLWGIVWRVARAARRRSWLGRWVPGVSLDRPDPRGSASDRYDQAERASRVMAVLHALPADQRELLWLAYAEGLTRAELQATLGLGPGTLSRRLTRARAAFEAAARERGLEPSDISGPIDPPGGDP